MKRVILTSLVFLAAFTSVMSADIRPAQANGRAIYHGAKGAYNSAQNGSGGGMLFGLFLIVGGVAAACSKS